MNADHLVRFLSARRSRLLGRWLCGLVFCSLLCDAPRAAEVDRAAAAQAFGQARPRLAAQPDGLLIAEAEEFQVVQPGWRAGKWGENYYAATFANSFLSRKAFLGAPEQADETLATLEVEIPADGQYLALVRYEAAYRFETQFRLRIEQNGRQVFDRLYGARDNLKIWAFREKLKKEVGWSWGAVENIVWEGHDAAVALAAGPARITLVAGRQPEPAARRNVDLVMLTTDKQQVAERIEKENYLPLDGMLTQSGDVWLRVRNRGSQPLVFQGRGAPGGGNWQQHSPYWVHIRNWAMPRISVAAGQTSDWVEVGGAMDALNDGQWFWTGDGPYEAEFAVRSAAGKLETLAKFQGQGDLTLAADADTRYTRRLRKLEDVLYDLLAYLQQQPAHGRTPTRTPIYGYTFDPLDDGRHAAAVREFKQLFGLSDTKADSGPGRGYIDVRGVPTPKLAEHCQALGDQAQHIAVVSLGDEIGLPTPAGADADEGFRQWLRQQNLQPSAVDPAAGSDWTKIRYQTAAELKATHPGVYYWSKRYQYHYGIQAIKERTDILRRHLPNAGIGANFSPHYPQEHMFLGEVFKWVSVFRADGMTLPWSEDYIWQVPVGTPQMNHINLDLFRAGLRHHPDRRIMYYVMPHMPNNTPNQWRRLFYGCLAHGMKVVDLFEFRPVHVAYTENHVDEPPMYAQVLRSFRELGLFEDIVQDGRVEAGQAALWFSETADIWGDSLGSYAAAKRALYTAIRHQQVPLDIVVEQDALDGTLGQYQVLYLTDAHVSGAASQAIRKWVEAGGTLAATAGAGMFDELNRPNQVLRELLGVEQDALDAPDGAQIVWLKQDLPFARPIDQVVLSGDDDSEQKLPVYCVRSRLRVTTGNVAASFASGGPAIVRREAGRGRVICLAFLPGLSYYQPAIPRRPMDRGATDDAMVHFLPTEFDARAARLIAEPADKLPLPVVCSQPLVETTILRSPGGVAIPLVNWSGQPVRALRVTIKASVPRSKISLASGNPVKLEAADGATVLVLDLDVADALILR